MNMDSRLLRIGTAVLACVLAMHLVIRVRGDTVKPGLGAQRLGQAIVFLTTGRVVRQADIDAVSTEPEPVTQPPEPSAPKRQPVTLSAEDAELVKIKNTAQVDVDIPQMIGQPLDWDLKQDGPAVLILHTHGSESYENTENYTPSSSYRTLDSRYNVVSVGERIAKLLEVAGIAVLHDRTLHDDPSYSGSYEQSRKSVQAYLEEYPSIRLVLDIHRDAAEDASGNQVGYTVDTPEGTAARLMLVLGTDAGGLHHPAWRENLSLGVKLQACLEKTVPGICRDMSIRTSRFNQDLSPGALLVEVGAAGNTRQEALVAAGYLAEAIIALAEGTK